MVYKNIQINVQAVKIIIIYFSLIYVIDILYKSSIAIINITVIFFIVSKGNLLTVAGVSEHNIKT